MKDLKTAILIFAHSAEHEATVKPFLHSKDVFESLNTRTLQLVQKTNLPYFIVTEKEQIGSNFGERFTNAIQSVYDRNYDSVIAIGNDTPHLTANHIRTAHKKLATNNLVLGSSVDGGFYLLGIKQEHFNPSLFLKLPWQKQSLTSSLTKYFKVNAITVSYLEKLRDLDSNDDVKKLFAAFRTVYSNLLQLFLLIVGKLKSVLVTTDALSLYLFESNYLNKGSPYSIL